MYCTDPAQHLLTTGQDLSVDYLYVDDISVHDLSVHSKRGDRTPTTQDTAGFHFHYYKH